jgi:hypothetical protein
MRFTMVLPLDLTAAQIVMKRKNNQTTCGKTPNKVIIVQGK